MHLKNLILSEKSQLAISIKFTSSKDKDEGRVKHSKSYNIVIMIDVKADEVVKESFKSLRNRHQIELETSMKGSDFIFDCVNLWHSLQVS